MGMRLKLSCALLNINKYVSDNFDEVGWKTKQNKNKKEIKKGTDQIIEEFEISEIHLISPYILNITPYVLGKEEEGPAEKQKEKEREKGKKNEVYRNWSIVWFDHIKNSMPSFKMLGLLWFATSCYVLFVSSWLRQWR